ncbi:holo-ACP synthase [Aliikangiella coralliicola]|uniref:Holo-[acyl-carrier-protein] synthase n=1 Tax=Aliikangiella coralliicola TaxID=2592383 RepID=A0A545UB32_9GAMM|nr:holo-ACP synthase [Aliikangiella coralliicola]TQV86671.1 holo-ACP synthase [Aliikangiella coralliicola]
MSIWGNGIDLCEISRVEKSLEKHGDVFANKILHPNEKLVFDTHRFKAKYLAKRFAAKEAFAKALGTGIAEGVILPDIEVINQKSGKPELRLHGIAHTKVAEIGDARLHLSISDERRYAVAQVIIELV